MSSLIKLVTTLTLLAIPAGLAFWAKKGFSVRGFDMKGTKGKVFLGILSFFTVIPMLAVYTPPEPVTHGAYLTWPTYRTLCSKPAWDKHDIANTMVQCNHLKYMMALWMGQIKKITVKNLDNPSESFIDMFPLFIRNWLKCTYGDEYPDEPEKCQELYADPVQAELCKLHISQGIKCHLNKMNRYTFEIWLKMPISKTEVHDVRVEVHHNFRDVVLQLRAGDVITVRASLLSELGNVWPVLRLYHVECKQKSISSEHVSLDDTVDEVVYMVRTAIFDTLNFFTSPVIQFGAPEKTEAQISTNSTSN